MGLYKRKFCSSSSYEPARPARGAVSGSTYGSCSISAARANSRAFAKNIVLPNPNPRNFEVTRVVAIDRFLVLKVKYPDSTNYEGNKILVFRDTKLAELMAQGSIDPHFCNNSKFKSPIARFVPTQAGWEMATLFAHAYSD